ncbi:hypothetical protein CLV84_2247 [Neolewinella xylanilytica]|uniref:Uncharacterized protein n=1 Tax=Neolewinella xylanilytica TaxID=1514080 RepID=A0A2S6I2P2_9BACT|nr:DUF6428 family protein [Neolewinella xylanilytica]PPK85351.1 hypothetical protein CLV84_2247 [Neolewinella xylanilytica]
MRLSELKNFLAGNDRFTITLPDGSQVPAHFHVTEVGEVTKNFIDCGGTVRRDRVASLQLWSADDYDHRLAPDKLTRIIEIAETELGLGNLEIEVEYQGTHTIEKFGLESDDDALRLTTKLTDCLAKDACGIAKKPKVSLSAFTAAASGSCTPGSGCC